MLNFSKQKRFQDKSAQHLNVILNIYILQFCGFSTFFMYVTELACGTKCTSMQTLLSLHAGTHIRKKDTLDTVLWRKALFHWKFKSSFFHINPEILANLFNLIYYLILTLTLTLQLSLNPNHKSQIIYVWSSGWILLIALCSFK